MPLVGTIRNGTIVLDQPLSIPEGTRVVVDVTKKSEPESEQQPTLLGLLKFAGVITDLPADFAAEHDHYIHGTPRRNPKES